LKEQDNGIDTSSADGDHAIFLGNRRDDGTMEIRFGDKDLEAKADFHPPIGNGQPLTPDYIATILERFNIVHGIDWDRVQEAALECNLNRFPVRDVLIAKGDMPVEDVAEYFEANPAFRKWPIFPEGDLPRIDYREMSPFILVKKNQILAKLHKKAEGKEGKDVHGNPIPFEYKHPEGVKSGANTFIAKDAIVAACEGRLVENKAELSIEETLQVKGTVGYKTGHIVFPGDVLIDGMVADGFKVYSGGSIIAKQTFDATEVIAKKDLLIAGGLIGRGAASVRVGGSTRAKFIQNCRVASRGSIIVSSGVINSHIYTLEKLDLGDKGKIIGGEIFAVKGVRAAAIGKEAGPATKIHCGVDFTAQQDLDKTGERMRIISMKLARVRELVKDPPDSTDYVTLEKRFAEELAKLSAQAGELLRRLDVDDTAVVEISGEVCPGTLIEICHIAYFTEQTLKRTRFRLEKAQGRLIHEPLS